MNTQHHLRTDSQGLVYIDEPFDIHPSLAYLVSLGELEHVDLVLPTTPNSDDIGRVIDAFVRNRRNIVFVEWNPEYPLVTVAGVQPVHLQLWFRKGSEDEVRRLIKIIEQTTEQSPGNSQTRAEWGGCGRSGRGAQGRRSRMSG